MSNKEYALCSKRGIQMIKRQIIRVNDLLEPITDHPGKRVAEVLSPKRYDYGVWNCCAVHKKE